MHRFGEVPIPVGLPLHVRDSRNGGLHGCILYTPNGKGHLLVLTPVEQLRLIRRTIRSDMSNSFALWHLACTGLGEFEIAGRRSLIAFAKFLPKHQPIVRQVPQHGHIAPLPLVRPLGVLLLCDNLRGIKIEGIVRD